MARTKKVAKPCSSHVRQLTAIKIKHFDFPRDSQLIEDTTHGKMKSMSLNVRKVRTRFKIVGSQKLFTSIFKESSRRENVNARIVAETFFGSTTRCTATVDAANFLLSEWLYSLWHGIN